jgi:hypothetical protein
MRQQGLFAGLDGAGPRRPRQARRREPGRARLKREPRDARGGLDVEALWHRLRPGRIFGPLRERTGPRLQDLHRPAQRVSMRRLLVALLAAGALAASLPTAASAATACGSVSYTFPGTRGGGPCGAEQPHRLRRLVREGPRRGEGVPRPPQAPEGLACDLKHGRQPRQHNRRGDLHTRLRARCRRRRRLTSTPRWVALPQYRVEGEAGARRCRSDSRCVAQVGLLVRAVSAARRNLVLVSTGRWRV